MGEIRMDLFMFEVGATSEEVTRNLATAMIAISATGQKSSQSEAPSVRFQTIQFFFIRAEKCRALWPICGVYFILFYVSE
jgi:hypothetical protein